MNIEQRLIDTLTHDDAWQHHPSRDPLPAVATRLSRRRRTQAAVALTATIVVIGGAAFSLSEIRHDDTAEVTPAQTGPTTLPSQPGAAPPASKTVPNASPHMRLTVTPTSGTPGTRVHILVTGCEDRSGLNHAVSYNNDSTNMGARNDHNTVAAITASQSGSRLTATYVIREADATGGTGLFTAQCGTTLRQAAFTVTH